LVVGFAVTYPLPASTISGFLMVEMQATLSFFPPIYIFRMGGEAQRSCGGVGFYVRKNQRNLIISDINIQGLSNIHPKLERLMFFAR
jgi:hypothetical protein